MTSDMTWGLDVYIANARTPGGYPFCVWNFDVDLDFPFVFCPRYLADVFALKCFVFFGLQATIPATLTQQYLFMPQQMKTCFVVQVTYVIRVRYNLLLAGPLSVLFCPHANRMSIVLLL